MVDTTHTRCIQTLHICTKHYITRWLTEISKRKRPEELEKQQQAGDEDGPPSSDEEDAGEKDAEETDDDASTSSSERRAKRGKASKVTSSTPPGSQEDSPESYQGYFERQREAKCAIHVTPLDSEFARLRRSLKSSVPSSRAAHVLGE